MTTRARARDYNFLNGDNEGLADPDDISIEWYIRKYYVEPTNGYGMKYPGKILKVQGYMGDMEPVEFWAWLLEPPKEGESKKAKGNSTVWPYADRLALCAAKFVRLDEGLQAYVLKARGQEKPIWWRGEDMEVFRRAARETYRYCKLDECKRAEYKSTALDQARRIATHGKP